MDESSEDAFDLDNSLKTVRRFRKKLRQIERLETIGRKLSPEEAYKVSTKSIIREKLQEIIEELSRRDESFNSTCEKISEDEKSSDQKDDSLSSSQSPVTYQENRDDEDVEPYSELPPATEMLLENIDTTESFAKEVEPVSSNRLPAAPITQDNKKEKQHTVIRKQWKNKVFNVTPLEGHNDVICDVDADAGWLVSGSRDTSVKLWSLQTNKELRNLSSHTGSVTCVKMLSQVQTERLRQAVASETNELMQDISSKSLDREQMLLTASVDCSIKLWLIPQGYLLKSIYNFSPVMAMESCNNVVFAGSDTGKLTAYTTSTGCLFMDTMIHDRAITCLKYDNSTLLSASTDGTLKLWGISHADGTDFDFDNIGDDVKLELKYKYESDRQILSACFNQGKILFGDDGINIKILDTKTETILKIPNHVTACGFTDALCVSGGFLWSTSYNIDTGSGSLNVRFCDHDLQLSYVTSLTHQEVPRLLCCVVDKSSGTLCLVSGGSKLLVWKENDSPLRKLSKRTFTNDGYLQVKGKTFSNLTKETFSSDVESEATADEDENGGSWWWSKNTDRNFRAKKVSNTSHSDSESSSDHSDDAVADQDNRWWCRIL